MSGNVAPRFTFTPPNPAALDPSTLEQLYAGGAARGMGPADNLVAADLAKQDRMADSERYYGELNKTNDRVMESGKMVLDHDQLMGFVTEGVKMIGADPMTAATPLGIYATNMGKIPQNLEMNNALAAIGAKNHAARRFKEVGEGVSNFEKGGHGLPTGLTADQILSAPTYARTPTAVQSAHAGNVNTGVKSRIETSTDSGSGIVTTKTIRSMDDGAVKGTPDDPVQSAARMAQSANASRFTSALQKDFGVGPDANNKMTLGTVNHNGQMRENVMKMRLPNGTVYGFIDGKAVLLNPGKAVKR